VKETVIEYVT